MVKGTSAAHTLVRRHRLARQARVAGCAAVAPVAAAPAPTTAALPIVVVALRDRRQERIVRRARGGVLEGAARGTERADIDAAQDLAGEVVAAELLEDALRARVAARGDRAEHALDLAQALLDGADVALRRAALVAGRCN